MKFNAKVRRSRRSCCAALSQLLQQKDWRAHEYVCSLNYFGYFGGYLGSGTRGDEERPRDRFIDRA